LRGPSQDRHSEWPQALPPVQPACCRSTAAASKAFLAAGSSARNIETVTPISSVGLRIGVENVLNPCEPGKATVQELVTNLGVLVLRPLCMADLVNKHLVPHIGIGTTEDLSFAFPVFGPPTTTRRIRIFPKSNGLIPSNTD
jgi:hypothetical protein